MKALEPEEAKRIAALSLLALLVLVPTAIASFVPKKPPAPLPLCADAAWRDPSGAVVCGAPPPGTPPLPPREALLAGVKLDLNTADAAALAIVPGIGDALAARIVEDRAAHGPFHSVSEVERVPGIGPKLAAEIARWARVRGL